MFGTCGSALWAAVTCLALCPLWLQPGAGGPAAAEGACVALVA